MTKEIAFSVSLKDCDVETKRGHGNGGQNRNTRDTAVRIVHRPSGAIGESQEERSQLQNKKTALKRLAETKEFKLWVRKQMGVATRAEIQVSEQMRPRFLKMEVQEEGKWVPTDLPKEWWK